MRNQKGREGSKERRKGGQTGKQRQKEERRAKDGTKVSKGERNEWKNHVDDEGSKPTPSVAKR